LIALVVIFLLIRRPVGISEFGFTVPMFRYAGLAGLFGLSLGLVIAWLHHLLPSKSPFDVSGLSPWMIGLYFAVGSPIQEEIIFRGLIQQGDMRMASVRGSTRTRS
jgi:membrane protease YdiL (CAAX protease family)